MSLAGLFHEAALRHPEKTAAICSGERIGYGALETLSARIAGLLRDLLGAPQSKVLILAHNAVFSLALFPGCFRANMIACPVNWRLSAGEVASILDQEPFALAFCDSRTLPLLRSAMALQERSFRVIVLDGEEYPALLAAAEEAPYAPRQAGDCSIQYFTSGTTGIPKGVLLPDESLEAYVRTYSAVSEWTEEAIYQTSANLFHLSGFSALISLSIGGTLVLMDQFRMEEFLGTMEREGVTRVSLVPTLINRVLCEGKYREYDFSRVRKIVYGGAPMLPEQIRNVQRHLSCDTEIAYGCTETCNISVLTAEDHRRILRGELEEKKLLSVGRPAPGVQVRIMGEDRKERPTGAIGSITVKSPLLYKGYSGPDSRRAFSPDGYHDTGDLGYRDEDGYIYIVDRKHDMIVCGGENIYPKEVELCISRMEDAVSQVSVVGKPDHLWGEIVVAFVVPRRAVTAEEIVDFCKKTIASYKKPRRVIFLKELPVNANGKVDKLALRAWLREHDGEESAPCTKDR